MRRRKHLFHHHHLILLLLRETESVRPAHLLVELERGGGLNSLRHVIEHKLVIKSVVVARQGIGALVCVEGVNAHLVLNLYCRGGGLHGKYIVLRH